MKNSLTAYLTTALLIGPLLHAQPVLPILKVASTPRAIEIESGSGPFIYSLADQFDTVPIDSQVVRFTAQYTDNTGIVTKNLDMALFTNRTPVTRSNFLNYVSDGDYLNSIIHRSLPGFVLQGGGFQIQPGQPLPVITSVPKDPPIVNEPGISNTLGTISMAKFPGNPNSATSEFFISTAGNSNNLDFQNGGFAVFGRLTKQTLPNALLLNNPGEFPTYNATSFKQEFTNLPLHQSGGGFINFDKFIRFTAVSLVPLPQNQAGTSTTLTYNVTNPLPSALASSVVTGNDLTITQNGNTGGLSTLTFSATDSVGNEVRENLQVKIGNYYQTWRAANYSGTDLTDDAISGPSADPNNNGIKNLQAFVQGLTLNEVTSPDITVEGGLIHLSYLERIDAIGTALVIERSGTLLNDWAPAPAQVISRQPTAPNQQLVTVQIAPRATRDFYRIRFDLLRTQ